MPPRRRRQHQKSEEELDQEWKNEMPPAIWHVHRGDFNAHFTAHKCNVIKADSKIEVLLGLRLTQALESCWDKGCKTTLLPPEGNS